MDCSMQVFPVLHHIPEFAQTHVHWVGDTIQPSHPLLFPSSPAFSLSQHQGLFQWINSSHQPKYWSFSFNISPSNEYSGLISFMIDWFDLLAVQGTLKSLLQHHSSKASIIWCSDKWQPTPVLLPGKSHGQRSLVDYSLWDRKESDTTERLHFHFSLSCIGEGNGNPLQYSCLENSTDGGVWWATVHGITKSWTWLSNFTRFVLSSMGPCGYGALELWLMQLKDWILILKNFIFTFK